MKKTINKYDFHRAFEVLRPENFSYDGLDLLYEWFSEYEDSTDEEIELDVIAICCDWAESSVDEIIQYFKLDPDDLAELDGLDDDERAEGLAAGLMEYLADRTSVAGKTDAGTIVYCSF